MDLIRAPWHWAVAGIFIGLTVPLLLLIGNKKFGISASMRAICAMTFPNKIPFFTYDWKKQVWNIFFLLGIAIGGFIASQFISNPNTIQVSVATQQDLANMGISDYSQIMPIQIFSVQEILTLKGLFFFVFGGFLVGFGTRYAGGCTSGHSIMGLSDLQIPSLIATCCFMIGGFFSANVLIPFILKNI